MFTQADVDFIATLTADHVITAEEVVTLAALSAKVEEAIEEAPEA